MLTQLQYSCYTSEDRLQSSVCTEVGVFATWVDGVGKMN